YERIELAVPAAVGELERERAAAVHGRGHRAGHDLDACRAHMDHQMIGEQRVEAAEHTVEPTKQRDLAAERAQHPAELDGDIAAADHRHALRTLLELEEPVRRDAE